MAQARNRGRAIALTRTVPAASPTVCTDHVELSTRGSRPNSAPCQATARMQVERRVVPSTRKFVRITRSRSESAARCRVGLSGHEEEDDAQRREH